MAEPYLAPEPPSDQLQPGQGVDRYDVRVEERAYIADDEIDLTTLQKHADALAESRNVGASDRTADDQEDCIQRITFPISVRLALSP
jgi:hypothetical protein